MNQTRDSRFGSLSLHALIAAAVLTAAPLALAQDSADDSKPRPRSLVPGNRAPSKPAARPAPQPSISTRFTTKPAESRERSAPAPSQASPKQPQQQVPKQAKQPESAPRREATPARPAPSPILKSVSGGQVRPQSTRTDSSRSTTVRSTPSVPVVRTTPAPERLSEPTTVVPVQPDSRKNAQPSDSPRLRNTLPGMRRPTTTSPSSQSPSNPGPSNATPSKQFVPERPLNTQPTDRQQADRQQGVQPVMPNRSRAATPSAAPRTSARDIPRANVDFPDRPIIIDRNDRSDRGDRDNRGGRDGHDGRGNNNGRGGNYDHHYDYPRYGRGHDRPVIIVDRSYNYPRPRYVCEPTYIQTHSWPTFATCDTYYGYGYSSYSRTYRASSDFRWGVSFGSGGSSFSFSSGYVDYDPYVPVVVHRRVWPSTCIVPARYVTPWWGVYRPSAGWYYPTTTYVNVNSPWVIPSATVVTDPYLTSTATYLPNPPAAAPISDTDPSMLDRAIGAMQAEQFDEAVEGFRRHLKDNFDDAEAMRQLSVAFVATRQMDDAAAMMRMAYRVDPGMGPYAINRRELGLTPGELRVLVNRSVDYANNIRSGSSWLLVAILMQAEGRNDLAKEMLERSRQSGGDIDLIDTLQANIP